MNIVMKLMETVSSSEYNSFHTQKKKHTGAKGRKVLIRYFIIKM
jgi:hypothetical protein